MAEAPKTVEEYIARLGSPNQEIAETLCGVIRSAAPQAIEGIKWGMPVYALNGNFCGVEANRSSYVNLQFFKGALIPDPHGFLEGTGKSMRHVKVRTVEQADSEDVKTLILEAVRLNS